jgi:acetyl-CoA acetyltransferase
MALKKAGLSLDDMKIMEINEAFACVPLVSLRILAGGDNEKKRLKSENQD